MHINSPVGVTCGAPAPLGEACLRFCEPQKLIREKVEEEE